MATLDQRFPQILRSFFPEFLELFFPEWAARLDLSTTQWMEPGQLPRFPEAQPFDLVARLNLQPSANRNPLPIQTQTPLEATSGENAECFVVVYFDVNDSGAAAGRQLPTYHVQLRQQTGLPVLPLVLFERAKGEGIGILSFRESFFDLETQVVRYLFVGLKGLSGIDYLATENPLGVALATLMAIPPDKVAWLGAEALRIISRSNRTDSEKFLLGEFIQANLPLDDAQKQVFKDLLATETYAEVGFMNKTVHEQGIKEGLVQAVLASLEGRFDSVPPQASEKIAALEPSELLSLLRAIPRADLIEDLPLIEGLAQEA